MSTKPLSILLLTAAGFTPSGLLAQTSLSIGNVPSFPGRTVAVPVSLRNPAEVVAAQFDVAFNPARVSVGAEEAGARLSNHVLRVREVSPGVRRVLMYSLGNAGVGGTNGAVVNVPCTLGATEYVGSGPITPQNVVLARRDASAVAPVMTSAGAVFARPVNRREDGVIDLFLPSVPDERYLIQATTNFVQWVNLSTNLALESFLQLVDLDGPNYPYRFYRSALFEPLFRGQVNAATQRPDGSVTLALTGMSGRAYTVEASSDLVTWDEIGNTVATGGRIHFTDAQASSRPHRFYRLRSQ